MIPVHTKWSGGERLASEDMTRWDDQALLPAVREGSEEAFAQLAGRYAPMIQKLASRCRNPLIDTEDLAQEGMLGLLSAARHFQNGSASFGAYAFVCVQHRMFSAVSRASRRQDRTLSDEDWQQEMKKFSPEREHGVDPAQQVLQREEEAQLFGQIQKWLSAREYQVLMLYLDAYSYEEIAKRLGVSVKTVDNALHRARKKVSAKLIESPQNN